MLTFALMQWVCVIEGEPERSGPKIYVSRAVSGSRKKSSAAERSAEREVAERAWNGERRSQKWERGAAKQPAPLRSNALHRRNRVSGETTASYIFVLIVYSHKVQSDSSKYNNQTVYLICRNATVLAFRLWPTTFTEAPFRLQNICRSGVPPRSGTTTALPTILWLQTPQRRNAQQYINVTYASLTVQVYRHSFCRWRLLPLKSAKSREIPRKFKRIAVQGHPRSSTLLPMESAYASSY